MAIDLQGFEEGALVKKDPSFACQQSISPVRAVVIILDILVLSSLVSKLLF